MFIINLVQFINGPIKNKHNHHNLIHLSIKIPKNSLFSTEIILTHKMIVINNNRLIIKICNKTHSLIKKMNYK